MFDAIAKGARKPGSRLAGVSEPLTAGILHLAPGKRRWYVTQAQPATSFPGLRSDLVRLSLAIGLAEVASAVLPHEQPVPEGFRFLLGALRYLEVHELPVVAAVWAEARFLGIAGFGPVFERCVVSGAKVASGRGLLSPEAGGYVRFGAAEGLRDAFEVRMEVLVGLAKISALASPPERLKFAEECYRALTPFWRRYADKPLPAREHAASLLDD